MTITPLSKLSKNQLIGLGVFSLVVVLALVFLTSGSDKEVQTIELPAPVEQNSSALYLPNNQAMVQRVDFKMPWTSDSAAFKPATTTMTKNPPATTVAPAAATPTAIAPTVESTGQPEGSMLIQSADGSCIYSTNASEKPELTERLANFFKQKKCKVVEFWQSHTVKHNQQQAATEAEAAVTK